MHIKYAKDNILCKVIDVTKPPFFLKDGLFNYKALVLYFMRKFRNSIQLNFSSLSSTQNEHLKREVFKNKDFIRINTHLDTLLHLINIDKKKIQEEKVLEQMIYDTLDFGEHIQKRELFKAKIASVGWILDTINKPDFIYGKESIIAKILDCDVALIRETGEGTSSQKYMYHMVALRTINDNKYTIVSQFPIEKDRQYSSNESKISQLHNYIQCDRPLYIRNGCCLPKYSQEKVTPDSAQVNRLHNYFGK